MEIPMGINCPKCGSKGVTFEVDEVGNEIVADCDDCDHKWKIKQ